MATLTDIRSPGEPAAIAFPAVTAPPPYTPVPAPVDSALDRLLAERGTVTAVTPVPTAPEPVPPSGVRRALGPGPRKPHLEPALGLEGQPDLPRLRRLIRRLPDSPARRVYEVSEQLATLFEHGQHDLVADLAGFALRCLAADPALMVNTDDWAWDAAVDLAELYAAACHSTGRPTEPLPYPLST